MHNINAELAELRRNFNQYYKQNLQKDYQNLEPYRRQHLRSLYLRLLIFTAPCLIAFLIAAANGVTFWQALNHEGVCKTLIIYIFIASVFCSVPFSRYKEETKSLVMTKILAFFGTFRYYFQKTPIPPSLIRTSELFGAFDNQTIDDSFQGTCRQVDLSVSEQHLTRTVQTNKGSHRQTVFKGVLILLKFNKNFSGKTIAVTKSNWRLFSIATSIIHFGFFTLILIFCGIGSLLSDPSFASTLSASLITLAILTVCLVYWHKKKGKNSLAPVYLEDVVFNKKWHVRATDQTEARYLLTPALMERLLRLKKLFHGSSLDFSFFNNQLLIAVHTNKDMFETTSLFTPALRYHKVSEVISQLYSVFAVTDLIKATADR